MVGVEQWRLPADDVGTVHALLAARHDERRAQALQLQLAARFADLHGEVTDRGVVVPGTEQLVVLGGEGTPAVAEMAPFELSVALEIPEAEAYALVADALDLRDRFPGLWQQVMDGSVPVWQARKVVVACRRVPLGRCAAIDGQASERLGSMPFGRVMRLVDGLVLAALDQEVVRDERERARASRCVWFRQTDHGVADLVGVVDAADAVFLDAQVARLASILADGGDTDSLDVRRAKALGLLASPARALQLLQASLLDTLPEALDPECPARGQRGHTCGSVDVDPERLLPRAQLVVHVTDEALRTGSGPARATGLRPLLVEWLADTLAGCRTTVRPVLDLDGLAPADAYEVPERMREAVSLRNPTSAFPYSPRASRGLDLDHTIPYDHGEPGRPAPPGQTRLGNLGPLTRRQHRAKTHAGWQVAQPLPGVYLWRSPLGTVSVTTPSGSWTLHVAGAEREGVAA